MNIKFNYYGQGKETVLFLHGWGANQNSFNFFYQKLSQNYKILQLDFLGHGESEKIRYSYSVYDFALSVFKILKNNNIRKINIVCHSFGARVGILLSTIFNISVTKMIILGGAGIKPRFNIFRKVSIYIYKLKKFLNKHFNFKFKITKYGSADYKSLSNIEKSTFVKIVNFDEKPYLQYISCPVLLVYANNDTYTPVYMGRCMLRHINNSRLIITKGNHFSYILNPRQVFIKIEKFLKG